MDQWVLELQLVYNKYLYFKWLDREVIFLQGFFGVEVGWGVGEVWKEVI